MIRIGQLSIQHTEGQARLCADISLNGKGTTLWFGVDISHAHYLCEGRSDAFVMALLPTAMRGGHDIVCDTPMSERLHYQLENYLIPTLCSKQGVYRPMKLRIPTTAQPVENPGGVATGFSGGVDSLHTIKTHGKDSPLPLTHLTHFNLGVYEGPAYREGFRESCRKALPFAEERGLELVCLDSNISQVLPERYLDVVAFRLLSGALALQGLLRAYLIASSRDIRRFSIDPHRSESYEYLLVQCAQTEALQLYNAGCQLRRIDKTKMLTRWEPARRWLHFCIFGHPGEPNCGHCKKCAREIATLYSYGALDDFGEVLELPTVKRTLPRQLGLVLANREAPLFDETAALLEESGVSIPQAAYIYAEQFRKAMKNLQEEQP